MIAPVILAVVAAIAGHPVRVACDADVNPSPVPTVPGAVVTAWTMTGGDTIHAMPYICEETNAQMTTFWFVDGLSTMIHEASHARGVRREACAEMIADIGVYDVLRRFYGVPFFSPMSVMIGRRVLEVTRSAPASYQPEACWAGAPS